jgi:hypothetical protein
MLVAAPPPPTTSHVFRSAYRDSRPPARVVIR